MSMGYDVAELLAEIRAKDAELKALVPNNFTETEINIVLDLLHASQTRGTSVEVSALIRKLQTALGRFQVGATLTDEERQLVLKHRAQKRGG